MVLAMHTTPMLRQLRASKAGRGGALSLETLPKFELDGFSADCPTGSVQPHPAVSGQPGGFPFPLEAQLLWKGGLRLCLRLIAVLAV